MTDTPHLGLPFLAAAQAQKHVTHNEALRIIDALVMLAVEDRDLTAPPASPTEGDRYLVKSPGSGAFAGMANRVAHFADGVWEFYQPRAGWVCFVRDEGALLAWNGTAWAAALDVLGGGTELQNLSRLGVGTTADASNPVAAKLNNALWTARTVAEGGDGSLRYKMSKENAASTVSLLMQDNYSGRAEIGLTGDDDFHFKVSADGATWHEGIVIDKATGAVSFPNTSIQGGRELLTANRTYYVRTDGSNSNNGLANTAGGAFLTIQKAIDTVAALDLSIYDVTIQVGNGTYTGPNVFKSLVGAGKCIIKGDEATPSNVVIQVTSGGGSITNSPFNVNVAALGTYSLRGMKLTSTQGGLISISGGGGFKLEWQNLEFGASAVGCWHVYVSGSVAASTGGYTISGNTGYHLLAQFGAFADIAPGTVILSGTPAFGTAFVAASYSANINSNATYSGSATGSRYSATLNGIINSNGGGASYFPGNSAGSTATGGQYV